MLTAAMKLKDAYSFGRRVINNPDSILKSRDITLPTKVRLVKAMVFSVVMYRCESWTIKKAEQWRIDAFELWCWRTPTNLRGNQSWIFTGMTDAETETPILRPPDVKNWFTRKDPDAGKDWRQEKGWDDWMVSPTRWSWIWASSGSWWWTGKPGILQSMGS